MYSPVQVYPGLLAVLLLTVCMLGSILRTGSRFALVALTAISYCALMGLIALWAARMDVSWLSPIHVFLSPATSPATIAVPGSVILLQMLRLFAGITLWKAAVIAAISHFAVVLANELLVFGF